MRKQWPRDKGGMLLLIYGAATVAITVVFVIWMASTIYQEHGALTAVLAMLSIFPVLQFLLGLWIASRWLEPIKKVIAFIWSSTFGICLTLLASPHLAPFVEGDNLAVAVMIALLIGAFRLTGIEKFFEESTTKCSAILYCTFFLWMLPLAAITALEIDDSPLMTLLAVVAGTAILVFVAQIMVAAYGEMRKRFSKDKA